MARFDGDRGRRGFPRDQGHCRRHVDRGVIHSSSGADEFLQELDVFLPAAAAEAYHVDLILPIKPTGDAVETFGIDGLAFGIGARGTVGFVEREPALDLPVAVVVELVIDRASAERIDQVRLDPIGELTGMDFDVRNG